MSDTDELVNAWLLEKFLWSGDYDKSKHGTIKSIKVVKVDMGWECECWSEWTRGDSFELTGEFTSSGGNFTWAYGRWGDLPQFIEELDEYQNNYCTYDEQDDDE
jgi:hypothetical protein